MSVWSRWLNFKRKIHSIKCKIFGTQIHKLKKKGAIIGDNVHMFNTYIDTRTPFLIEIGNNVTLTDVKILSHDASTFKELGFTKIGKVKIGDNVFVGAKTVILPNVTIGNNVIVGAGSVVTKDIPENSVAVGNPCRVIKSYQAYIEENRRNCIIDKCIDKDPEKLTEKEIHDLKRNIEGIWYIR